MQSLELRSAASLKPRSGCAIKAAVEILGDPWAMLVLRDIMFGNKRHFREMLTGSEEGIASNILSSRLKQLTAQGLLSRAELLRDGGPELVNAMMDELREHHFDIPGPDPDASRPSEQLQAATTTPSASARPSGDTANRPRPPSE